MPPIDQILQHRTEELVEKSLFRILKETYRKNEIHVKRDGIEYISFSCNDYLGLSQNPKVKNAAIDAIKKYGVGSGASRLVTGNNPLYKILESNLAEFKNTEDAVVFGSGYLTNIGTIAAIVGKGDLILIDKWAHACLIDGVRLSGAKFMRFSNNNTDQCEELLKKYRNDYQNCLIVTDAVFSMDGHVAPVAELSRIAKKYDSWVMTDDAHGLGVVNKTSDVEIQSGTLSKAVGGYGGYVCGSKILCEYIRSTARSLVYSTALPPATLASAIAALEIISSDKELTEMPLKNAKYFTDLLVLDKAQSPIVPIIIGDEKAALDAAEKLKDSGFLVTAIRPPTVPKDSARLRFTFSALHKREEIAKLADVVRCYLPNKQEKNE